MHHYWQSGAKNGAQIWIIVDKLIHKVNKHLNIKGRKIQRRKNSKITAKGMSTLIIGSRAISKEMEKEKKNADHICTVHHHSLFIKQQQHHSSSIKSVNSN